MTTQPVFENHDHDPEHDHSHLHPEPMNKNLDKRPFLIGGAILGVLLIALVIWLIAKPQTNGRGVALTGDKLTITINPDGSFSPPEVVAHVGDVINWTDLGPQDSIVPYLSKSDADACENENAAAVDFETSFIGPSRSGIPGLYVRSYTARGGGPEIIDNFSCGPGPAPYPTGTAGCCDNDPSPAIGSGGEAYCDDQKTQSVPLLPDEMWDYPELMGELVIIDWAEIETADQVFDFSTLTHELDAAADHGKHVTIAVKTGQGSVPDDWIFGDIAGDNITPLELEGNNSEGYTANCGANWQYGSFTDPAWVNQLNELITALGTHVKSDGAWVQATSAALLIGLHIGTDEVQVQGSCPDENHDNILDTVGGDACTCNSAVWANAVNGGWTPKGVEDFVIDQVAFWQNAFWPDLVVRMGLKQAGLVAADGPTNFAGDHLLLPDGVTPICPTCAGLSDNEQLVSSSEQFDNIIERGLETYGDKFWVMHHGLDPLPTEFGAIRSDEQARVSNKRGSSSDRVRPDATQNCSWGGTPDLTANPPIIPFPIPLVGPVATEGSCPNKWAVNTTLTPPRPHMTGFQTNNPNDGAINDPASLESSMLNLERNTNAVYWEGYASVFWMNHNFNGSNGDMNPLRETAPYTGIDPDMRYSKSAVDHNAELIARRESEVFADTGPAFPETYSFVFGERGTYNFYNPRTCSDGAGQAGTIIIE